MEALAKYNQNQPPQYPQPGQYNPDGQYSQPGLQSQPPQYGFASSNYGFVQDANPPAYSTVIGPNDGNDNNNKF